MGDAEIFGEIDDLIFEILELIIFGFDS